MDRARAPSSLVVASVLGVVATFLAIVSACSVDVDLSNKGCPCPPELQCDTSTNKCVASLATQPGDSGPPPVVCNDAECKCETAADCADKSRGQCGPNKTCVECVSAPADTCSAGGYCNDKNQCVVGCKTGNDCQNGQKCKLDTHQCVECVVDPDCAAGGATKRCSPSGKCAESCTTGEGTPCGAGGTCCGGFCLLLAEDVFNCGACGKACSNANATPSCKGGVCEWKCADGYAHCALPAENTGCETNIRNVTNCGGCGIACATPPIVFTNGVACLGAKCTYTTCQQGHYDKNANPNDG